MSRKGAALSVRQFGFFKLGHAAMTTGVKLEGKSSLARIVCTMFCIPPNE
jgi:hypothetical protein